MFIRSKNGEFYEFLPRLCFTEGDNDPGPGGGTATPVENQLAEPSAPAPEGDAAPAATEATEGTEPTETEKRTPWFQKRINEVTGERREAVQRAEQAEAEVSLLRSQLEAMRRDGERPSVEGDPTSAPRDAGDKPLTRAEIDAMVKKEAADIVRANEFTAACNRTAEAGVKAFEDFPQVRDELVKAFGDKIAARPDFFEAVTGLSNGHEVFYRLGKDLDLASQVFDLSPTKMAIKLAEISAEAKAKPAPARSNAPPPIRTVDGAARAQDASIYDAGTGKIGVADFIKLREKQIADDNKRRYGRAS